MAEDLQTHGDVQPQEPARRATSGNDGQQPAQDEDDAPPRQTLAGKLVSFGIVLLAVLLLAIVIRHTDLYPRTDDAEVFANFIGMAPVVNGPITELNVRDNQQVQEGDVLFRIDDRPYKYALANALSQQAQLEGQIVDEEREIRSQQSAAVAAQAAQRSAEAQLNASASTVEEQKAMVGNAEAALARAKAEYAYSLNNLHRVEPLLAKQFVTVDQVDQLRTGTEAKGLAVTEAEAQLNQMRARLAASIASLNASTSEVYRSQAQKRQSEHAITTLDPLTAARGSRTAAIDTAQYNFNHCVVTAPFNARVTDLTISQGAFAHAGVQVFTLIDTRVWWVVANFRETQLHRILPGMHVDVYLMSQPHTLYRGVVDSTGFGVQPDASTVGALTPGLPDVQRTLSWVHLASRYPVRIRVLDPEPDRFRISESAVVVVHGWNGW